MAKDHAQTRSTRNNLVNYKETSTKTSKAATKLIKTKPITTSTVSSVKPASATSKLSSIARPSLSAVRSLRLSSSPQTSVQSVTSADKVQALESGLNNLEISFNNICAENTNLKQAVNKLQGEVFQLKDQIELLRTTTKSSDSSSTSDQLELNSNIIIRGIDVTDNTPDSELLAVYEGLRTHLGVSDVAELIPVSVKVLAPNPLNAKTSFRPIQVVLTSITAKKKFLEIRRSKKDIHPSDIGITNNFQRPILVTEQLTRSNQELSYQARSLRGHDGYKFIWSNNDQILARFKHNSKVIRVTDKTHINQLRLGLNREPLVEDGRHRATTFVQPSAD